LIKKRECILSFQAVNYLFDNLKTIIEFLKACSLNIMYNILIRSLTQISRLILNYCGGAYRKLESGTTLGKIVLSGF
jgi:hypothetical protein